jgi:hypothetical protein
MAEKSTKKTTKRGPLRGIAVNPEMRGNGRGPAKGAPNAGRPRDEWKAWLRSLVDSPLTRASIEQVLQDPSHPAFPRVLTWADERGWGKETQGVEGGLTLTVVRRDESGGVER